MFVFLFDNATITYRSVQELYRGGIIFIFFSDGVRSTSSPFRETRGFKASAAEDGARRAGGTRFAPTEPKARP